MNFETRQRCGTCPPSKRHVNLVLF